MVANSKTDQEDILKTPSQFKNLRAADLNIPNTAWRVSVIDLGYNSLKMVSYEVRPDGLFRAYDQRGSLVRLGEGLDKLKKLSRIAMNRTIRALTLLNEINTIEKVDRVIAIATSAVREAVNGPKFVERVESSTGIKFRVLTRQEEALLSYIGSARTTRFSTVLFFDLGGGSLELTYVEDWKIRKSVSLPLGALRLTELFGLKGGGYTKKNYEKLRAEINRLLPTREELNIRDDAILIGVGGTVRALARYDQWKNGYQLNKIHNYILRRKSIAESHKTLRSMTIDKISHIDSFGKDRAESVTTGALIIATLMIKLDFRSVIVSTHGLRDGVLSEYLRDSLHFSTERYTVERANNFLEDSKKDNSEKNLVHSLGKCGILNKREEYILDSTLSNFMDLYLTTRPETLFYSIISLDSVLDHREQMAAAIALIRAKSPKIAKWYIEYYSGILRGIGRESIYKMGAIVVLEEILHRTGSKASIDLNKETLTINIESGMERAFPRQLLNEAVIELEREIDYRVRVILKEHSSIRNSPHSKHRKKNW